MEKIDDIDPQTTTLERQQQQTESPKRSQRKLKIIKVISVLLFIGLCISLINDEQNSSAIQNLQNNQRVQFKQSSETPKQRINLQEKKEQKILDQVETIQPQIIKIKDNQITKSKPELPVKSIPQKTEKLILQQNIIKQQDENKKKAPQQEQSEMTEEQREKRKQAKEKMKQRIVWPPKIVIPKMVDPKQIDPSKKVAMHFQIPIVFIWIGGEMPSHYKKRLEWITFPHIVLGDSDWQQLATQFFQFDLNPVRRSDILRLLYIYKYGGVYSDLDNIIDYECLMNILAPLRGFYMFGQPYVRKGMANAFLYSDHAGEPLIRKILDQVKVRLRTTSKKVYHKISQTGRLTGPYLLRDLKTKQLQESVGCIRHEADYTWSKGFDLH